MQEPLTRKAYAKINLCLDVLRKRPDGYHDLRMIMQTVGLYDELTFTLSPENPPEHPVRLVVEHAPLNADLGPEDRNLISRAANLILDTCSVSTGVTITLNKRIPVAAGMAGGSTDAACVFHGLNQLLALDLSTEDMCRMGVTIGADVPYCIMGGTMLSEGIGDVLSPLPNPPACYLLIAKPDINVSTGFVYGNLKLDDRTVHPDVDGMITALSNRDLSKLCSLLGNVLESVTVSEYKIIDVIKKCMTENGALGSLMSGSGPTVFGIFTDRETAERTGGLIRLKDLAKEVFVTEFVNAL